MHPGAVVADRWEILEPIGVGGMGDVYRVRHRLTKAEAALKIVRARGSYTEEDATRFAREASAPERIGHERIAAVLDAGVDPGTGQLYLVTELLHGDTLRAFMGPSAIPTIIEMLEPLAAAHAGGFVHRDLKPENVFVDRDRGVMLLDFGLVRAEGDRAATADGQMMGTPFYMAPEQARSARDATATADVWAVGVMLYEAITGRRPFDSPSVHGVIVNIQTAHHPPLSIVAPNTPAALSALVEQCLDKHPDRRPAHAGELLQRLRAMDRTAVPRTRPSPAAPVASPGLPRPAVDGTAATLPSGPALRAIAPPTKPRSRAPLAIVAVAGVGLLCLVAAGGAAWFTSLRHETVTGVGWQLEIPHDWEEMPPSSPQFVAIYGAPFDEAEGGTRTTVSVWKQGYGGTLEQYVEQAIAGTIASGGFIDRNVPSTLSGLPAREVQFTYRGYEQGSYSQCQRIVVTNGFIWSVACTGAATGFDDLRPRCLQLFEDAVIGH